MRVFILLIACWLTACMSLQAGEPANPLLVKDALYVSKQGIHKFERSSLQQIWSSLIGVETFDPVMAGELLLIGSTQGLYALDSNDGEVLWHIEKQRTIFSPVVSDKAYAGSLHGELYSVNADGKINWSRQFSGWIYSPAINEAASVVWTGGQGHKVFSLSLSDGNLVDEIATTQELIFSPIDIGNNRVAINLFDGRTLIIEAKTGKIAGWLDGSLQPKDIHRYDKTIYRTDRGGHLFAFDFDSLDLLWSRSMVYQDLTLHPSQSGFLLLSDLDQTLILFDLEKNQETCRDNQAGHKILPIQVDSKKILYFQKIMQPPWLLAVQMDANCQ